MSLPPLPSDADRRRNVESWRRGNGMATPRRTVQAAAPAPVINWDDDVLDIQPVKRTNYVAPAPTAITRIEPAAPLGYMPSLNIPAPVVTVDDDGRWAVQRAKGFAIKTSMLGAGFALAAATVVLLVLLGRAPGVVTGLIVLVVLFATFAATWAYALRTEVQVSAGGIARRHADGLWDFFGKEQSHLHEMEKRRWNP